MGELAQSSELLMLYEIFKKLSVIEVKENIIMSQITDWAATEEADLTAIKGTLNTITTDVTGFSMGVTALDELIQSLEGGGLSDADIAKLAEVKGMSAGLVIQGAAVVTQISAISVAPPVPAAPANPVTASIKTS